MKYAMCLAWTVPFLSSTNFDEVEQDIKCQAVLRARMAQGMLHKGDIESDVRGFSAAGLDACGVTAGFPCQVTPTWLFSSAQLKLIQRNRQKIN